MMIGRMIRVESGQYAENRTGSIRSAILPGPENTPPCEYCIMPVAAMSNAAGAISSARCHESFPQAPSRRYPRGRSPRHSSLTAAAKPVTLYSMAKKTMMEKGKPA